MSNPPDSSRPVLDEKSPPPGIGSLGASARDVRRFVILGVSFFGGSVDEAVEETLGGGLVMLPSGPGLACDLPNSLEYRQSLAAADLVLPDSGAMVLAWNFMHRGSPQAGVPRISGLTFLRKLLGRGELHAAGFSFWVMPSEREREANFSWLGRNGFEHLSEADAYVAPNYRALQQQSGEISDPALVAILEERRPRMIFLNVGGGVQEPLGAYLKSALSYRPAIICSGAAIAFLTGGQASIPPWADRFCLGWFLRVLHSPSRFGVRYLRALPLFALLARYGANSPKPL